MSATSPLTFTESEYEPNRFSIGCDGNWLMAIQHNGEQLVERQRENMRRLVACWNACEGIDTENLETNGVASMPEVLGIIRERKQLADALQAMLADEYEGRSLAYAVIAKAGSAA